MHIPNLLIEYYACNFFTYLARKISNLLKLHDSILRATRGKYARMYVEIDLCRPLLSKFCLHRKVCRNEYKGIHQICFSCCCHGYTLEDCSSGDANNVVNMDPVHSFSIIATSDQLPTSPSTSNTQHVSPLIVVVIEIKKKDLIPGCWQRKCHEGALKGWVIMRLLHQNL